MFNICHILIEMGKKTNETSYIFKKKRVISLTAISKNVMIDGVEKQMMIDEEKSLSLSSSFLYSRIIEFRYNNK